MCINTEKKKGLIDLHLHLDGSISVQSARELAKIEGVTLPGEDEALRKLLTVSDGCRDLNEYLTRFSLPCSLLESAESLSLATYNLCRELEAAGYIYAEIRFAPQKHGGKGLSQDGAVSAAIDGLRRSGFHAQLILCCMREGFDNREANLETVRLTRKYWGQGVCACDLAGAEALYPNEQYAYIFEEARKLGVPFTIHAGEALGAESVAIALDYGARRIGHGIRAYESEAVVARLAREGVALEVCPTSNLNTAVFPSIAEMPIPALIEAGVTVTVNADNMSVSATDVGRELALVRSAFGYQREDIKGFLIASAKAAFLSEAEKEALVEQINGIFEER